MITFNFLTARKNAANIFGLILPLRSYAARKGYREKAKKKKVKVEVKKMGFIPHNQRDIRRAKITTSRKIDDSWKWDAKDDVYITKFYRWKVYNFSEAVNCHRETHHPTVYNLPKAPLNVLIELDMRADKKNKYVDQFSRIAAIPYPYDHGEERKIVAFCKTPELQKVAMDAGASLSGGSELIKNVQVGETTMRDYQYVVAHPDILPELVSLRGLMKKNFPSIRNGTLVNDIASCIVRLSSGVNYHAQRDSYEEDYGWIDTCLGTLDMTDEELEGNFKALLLDVSSIRPKRDGPFVTRCLLLAPPSVERFKVDHSIYIGDKVSSRCSTKDSAVEESDDSGNELNKASLSLKQG